MSSLYRIFWSNVLLLVILAIACAACVPHARRLEEKDEYRQRECYLYSQEKMNASPGFFCGYGIGVDKNYSRAFKIAEIEAWRRLSETIHSDIDAVFILISQETGENFVFKRDLLRSTNSFPPEIRPVQLKEYKADDGVFTIVLFVRYGKKEYLQDKLFPFLPSLNLQSRHLIQEKLTGSK